MYCDTIPYELAVKLKEKGMPIFIEQEWYPNGMPKAEKDCHKPMTTYAQVFDWLMEKGYAVCIMHRWTWETEKVMDWLPVVNVECLDFVPTWQEAANAAIEKALELIKEESK